MSVFIPTAAPRGRMRGWGFCRQRKAVPEEPLRRRRRRQAAVWVAYIAHLCRRGSVGEGLVAGHKRAQHGAQLFVTDFFHSIVHNTPPTQNTPLSDHSKGARDDAPRDATRGGCGRTASDQLQLTCLSSSAASLAPRLIMATPAQIAEFQRYTDGVGGVRQSHTGVSNKAMTRGGLEKQKVMIEPGVYKVRTAALNVQYHGFDDAKEDIEFTYKVKLTVPEKWLDNATPDLDAQGLLHEVVP